MNNNTTKPLSSYILQQLQFDLGELDRELVPVDGKMLKASQCFHVGLDPLHILFNTNCPDTLKEKVQSILSKHIPLENRPQQ